jgi:hypothetical protein
MLNYTRIYDDSNGIDQILDQCNEEIKYYRRYIDIEISTTNDADIIKYYKRAISSLEDSIGGIIRHHPGNKAIVYLLCGLDLRESGFTKPTNSYLYSVLDKAIKCNRLNQLYMIYLRDTIYVKSLHNVVKENIDKLSISVDMNRSNDDSFEYSINNIISELKKMDLLEAIDVNRVIYISEIYLMVIIVNL